MQLSCDVFDSFLVSFIQNVSWCFGFNASLPVLNISTGDRRVCWLLCVVQIHMYSVYSRIHYSCIHTLRTSVLLSVYIRMLFMHLMRVSEYDIRTHA